MAGTLMRGSARGPLRTIGFVCFSLLLCSPPWAVASMCGDLEAERFRAHAAMLRLVADYPGTHAMLAGCAAAANDDYKHNRNSDSAAGTFLICAGLGCAMVGFDNCSSIARDWFVLYGRVEQLAARMRELGCAP